MCTMKSLHLLYTPNMDTALTYIIVAFPSDEISQKFLEMKQHFNTLHKEIPLNPETINLLNTAHLTIKYPFILTSSE